jgi:hypothetical protein
VPAPSSRTPAREAAGNQRRVCVVEAWQDRAAVRVDDGRLRTA